MVKLSRREIELILCSIQTKKRNLKDFVKGCFRRSESRTQTYDQLITELTELENKLKFTNLKNA